MTAAMISPDQKFTKVGELAFCDAVTAAAVMASAVVSGLGLRKRESLLGGLSS